MKQALRVLVVTAVIMGIGSLIADSQRRKPAEPKPPSEPKPEFARYIVIDVMVGGTGDYTTIVPPDARERREHVEFSYIVDFVFPEYQPGVRLMTSFWDAPQSVDFGPMVSKGQAWARWSVEFRSNVGEKETALKLKCNADDIRAESELIGTLTRKNSDLTLAITGAFKNQLGKNTVPGSSPTCFAAQVLPENLFVIRAPSSTNIMKLRVPILIPLTNDILPSKGSPFPWPETTRERRTDSYDVTLNREAKDPQNDLGYRITGSVFPVRVHSASASEAHFKVP